MRSPTTGGRLEPTVQSDLAPPDEAKRPGAGQTAAEKPRQALRAAAEAQQASVDSPPPPPPKRSRLRLALYIIGGTLLGLVLAVVLFLLLVDWNAMRGPIGRYLSDRMNREVVLAGDLDVHPWSWRPRASVEGLRIGNPSWAGKGPMADIGRLDMQIRLLPLLKGDVDLMLVQADRPRVELRRNQAGLANWDFSNGQVAEPMRLPPIRKFVIKQGRLDFRDEGRGLSFKGTVEASEKLGAANRGFQLLGDGVLNAEPFRLNVTGGPLLNIERDKPYPFDAVVRAGATRVTARGQVIRPFDLGRLTMAMTARGDDLADLYGLTGVPLPNTPPYRLTTRFVREGAIYRLEGLTGRVGDSDLAGKLKVDAGGKRPMLTATLRTRSLDFDDMAAVFGGAPKAGAGETASPVQAAIARELTAEQRLLPDATLDVRRLRAMDAEVDYHVSAIRDAPLPLRAASVKLDLDRGLLVADPLRLDLPQGLIYGSARLNGRPATPVAAVDLRVTHARLEQMVPMRGGSRPLTGVLAARLKLEGAGDSVRRAAANADGQVTFVVPNGEIRKAFAELLGVNIVKGLGLLMKKDQDTTPIHCAVASFDAKDGVLRADRIIFDTGPVLGKGSGTIDLRTERVDLRIQGKPKKFRIGRLDMPVTAKGPLKGPKLGVDADGALAQGGIAAAIGSALGPLAAILPFVDPGLAKDAACNTLIAEASQEGAPVTRQAKR
jgi:uncharacterized protein involved in outer membrane biogenesis